ILSFTADEVWQHIPGKQGSVHLQLFPESTDLAPLHEISDLYSDWEKLLQRRTEVLAKLEALRADKVIGKALESIVTLHVSGESEKNLTEKYLGSFPELFNVSEVDLLEVTHNDPDYLPNLAAERSKQNKCDRCWRHVPDVGSDGRYPSVCGRCAQALDAIDFPPYPATV